MNVYTLPIEEGLKQKLDSFLKEYESYRLIHGNLVNNKLSISKKESKAIEKKKANFFSKFFFSEFDKAS
ncbi:hypothetical protein [Tenacibaculum sp. IB213877]|uniref:hypothetical protein n=1 Tax=Tenacibaculum sp. IB213877 TaxID=3097351 RepID=UPI002A5AD368|nr:hypothetical protein [Tenacibaculum sp. IB213877]MDY0780801.1 hypothetical protein [Tenacibaculum sp. IB213877]